jgi:hypothetical protein
MGFLNKLFGFRWSLYIIRNENQLAYAMHEHSVRTLVEYAMLYFAKGGRPVEPWSLCLNFNKTHQIIKLEPELFTADGWWTPALKRQLESIDPGWLERRNGEPWFEEAATKRHLKITDAPPLGRDLATIQRDLEAMLNSPQVPETTFYSVMDEVFGKR